MAQEIERKYLVDMSKLPKLPKKNIIKQGYFNSKGSTIRVRISNDKAYLTIKGKTKGISRSEFEYSIPLQDAIEMQDEFCGDLFVEKTRYNIEYKGHIWELDIFKGKNEGLVVVEIELNDENEKFKKPDWITEDVTMDRRYSKGVEDEQNIISMDITTIDGS